ncbi:hypothetical protein CAMRE0001_2546 [Campylobacter rectus RM3267]|uniref:Uncharacterized protein n=2 Tax=Campylobacter rectus TaxID=203 RepID=A0A6G5QKV3_CAMRE|nr:hypothetical protein [Campylobacter rectus]EEF13331.1 hypothetical protein CAMRE0001_2546 [Campylobacter rectus RM3267]QCD46106.1 hypothetical protein CRECT_0411 [Campylobacter rectus]
MRKASWTKAKFESKFALKFGRKFKKPKLKFDFRAQAQIKKSASAIFTCKFS